MDRAELSNRIIHLCKTALYGDEKLEYFVKFWPHEADIVPFYRQCRDDVFDCVEHWPRTLFSNKIPPEWYRMDEYLRLYLDYNLLVAFDVPELLQQYRDTISAAGALSRDAIDSGIESFLRLQQ